MTIEHTRSVADTHIGPYYTLQSAMSNANQNWGVKKPIIRYKGLRITLAPSSGANPGALYVKRNDTGEYLGKITNMGFFHPMSDCSLLVQLQDFSGTLPEDIKDLLSAEGKRTGTCCICGRTLTDPISVEQGIGPICSSRFGF